MIIKVVSDDTDVFVILAHHLHAQTNGMPREVHLLMESCSSRHHTAIDVNEVVKKHLMILPNRLAAHALTGCDSMSSFSGIGKATALKILEKFDDIIKLGNPSICLDEVVGYCLRYVNLLY